MLKKIQFFVTTLLMVSLLAACTSAVSTPSTSDTTLGSTNEDSATTQETDGKLIAEPLTISYLFPENAYQPISQDSISLKTIQELTNVTLNFELVPGSDYDTRKSTAIATDSLTDVFFGNQSDIRQYGRGGMFLNLSDYQDYMPNYLDIINADDRKEDAKSLYLDNNLYSFVRLEYFRLGTATQPMIRMDVLEDNNIDVPTTWDELYDVFLKMKEANPDSYIMATRNGTNYLIGQLAYPLGSGGFQGFSSQDGIYFEPESNEYLFGPIQENFKKVIQFLANMYADGLLDPDYAVLTRDLTWEKLSNGGLLFYYDNNTFAARTFNPALKEIDEGAYFDLLDPMTNSFGQVRSLRYQRDWYADTNIINSEVERPEDVVTFMDWCYSNEGMMVTNFGAEGESYTIEDGQPQVAEEIYNKHANADDVLSAIQAELGTGQFNFTPYINEEWFKQTSDPIMVEHGNRIDALTLEGKIDYMRNPIMLAFSDEESEELTNMQTNVMTVFNSEIDKFITGTTPMSEYDDLIVKLNEQGAQTIQDMYNDAYSRME